MASRAPTSAIGDLGTADHSAGAFSEAQQPIWFLTRTTKSRQFNVTQHKNARDSVPNVFHAAFSIAIAAHFQNPCLQDLQAEVRVRA
jgi:hypothetical protein